ncbi:MAG: helix-turn-helix transcriptional regulator [Prevotella sp.]|nr:helix-turn-helix transcriptional regulator [Prevotella sp.]
MTNEEFIKKCTDVVEANLTNPDFKVGMMAYSLAMSHSSLYKRLREVTGMSIQEFVNDYKIDRAIAKFTAGATTVRAVAEQCGISDPKHFRTLFRRKTGMSPTEFLDKLNASE